MRNNYTEQELAAQLKRDLNEGESWHVEFKAYDHMQLDTMANSWKDDLSAELAALASIGGKIYIGICDDSSVQGISGSHQMWQEKLFERALGRVKPRVNWKSYLFVDPATGRSVIRIDVLEGEPMYYVMGRPYIRDGTTSRPAEPEEVKARFQEYFANRVPIELEHSQKGNPEQAAMVSWIMNELMNVLSTLNLYEQKSMNPQFDSLKIALESSRDAIESNLSKVKRILGGGSGYYQGLESIVGEILAATKVRLFMGDASWSEWLGHLKKVYDTSSDLLATIKSSVSITIEGLNEQEEDVRDKATRWLRSIDDYTLNKFIYEANQYVHMLLRLHFLFWLNNEEQKASHYKEIANEIEILSWARVGADYQAIKGALPELQQKLNTSS